MNINVKDNLQFAMMRLGGMNMLDSTKEKLERQQQAQSKVDLFQKQQENLKSMECDSVEEIARKLEMFHNYEDEIAAAKKEYNNSQMYSVLDEAREQGEKIAKAAEKMAPKTEEERKEEMREEALGIDEEKGMLTEMLEECTEAMEETMELLAEGAETVKENAELLEETAEIMEETTELPEEAMKESPEAVEGSTATIEESAEVMEGSTEVMKENAEAIGESTETIDQSIAFMERRKYRITDAVGTAHKDFSYDSMTDAELERRKNRYVPIDVRL